MRHDLALKSWLVQRNRKRRQNETGPVVYAELGDLESSVSPAIVAHPPFTFVGGTNYDTVTWASSDLDVIDFDSSEAPIRFNLKAPGTATITATFANDDGTEYTATKTYTIT